MTEPDKALLQAIAARLVLGSGLEHDVQGQLLVQSKTWVQKMGLVDDNDLAGFIDGTLDPSKRRQVIAQLCENTEFRAVWLDTITGST